MLIKEIDVKTIVDQITVALDGKDEGILCNTSYETGLLGYALYYAFLAKYKDEESYLITAQNYFDKAIAALDIKNFQRMYDTDSIDAHLSHIGRFVAFTSEHKLLEIDAEEYLAKLDEILFELMKSKVSIKDFDSLSGAMAAGYYFLSRAKNGIDVEKQIAFLIHSLENCAEKDKDGDYFGKVRHSIAVFTLVFPMVLA